MICIRRFAEGNHPREASIMSAWPLNSDPSTVSDRIPPHARTSDYPTNGDSPPSATLDAMKTAIAWSLYEALQEATPTACVSGAPKEGDDCIIDGGFDLFLVAREMIKDLHARGFTIVAFSKEE